jgi:exodeoxyribonuclease V alpha subunit
MLLRFSAEFEGTLRLWLQAQLLRPLDVALLRALPQAATLPEHLLLYLMLASSQLAQGHLCLDLQSAASDPLQLLPLALRDRHQRKQLQQFCKDYPPAAVASALAQYPALVATDTSGGCQPFVLKGQRLYLRRYAEDEAAIGRFIASRRLADEALRSQLNPVVLRQMLQTLFKTSDTEIDWQQQACALAASSYFAVITGGPGTGKTTTVMKLLLLLLQQAAEGLHIVLAAPTGKAAARLTESLAQSRPRLAADLPELVNLLPQLPQRAQTVHRLLAPKPDGSGFRYHAGQMLPADVVIVDEASMLDVSLFAALVRALPPQCRLILLGDKDQLASVEAGAVLAEICRQAQAGGYSQDSAQWLFALTGQALPPAFISAQPDPLDQQVVMLRHSHRFGADSGIGKLARAVNEGDPQTLPWLQQLAQHTEAEGDIAVQLLNGQQLATHVCARLTQWLQPYLALLQTPVGDGQADQQALLLHQQLTQVQLLCAVRQGPAGVETINQALEQYLAQQQRIHRQGGWYHGRPVIVLQNDYSTGLMNGDIGICLAVQGTVQGMVQGAVQTELRVAFLQPDEQLGYKVRWFLPGRLPPLESAFALTVHKSQGSEFQHAILLLPPADSQVLTRELIYTAITRAKSRFSLYLTDWQVLGSAINRRIVRHGGLRLD